MAVLGKWVQFIRERFPILTHGVMILFLMMGNLAAAKSLFDHAITPYQLVIGFVGLLCIFLRMRIFDEIKDYDTDKQVRPERPLARGLITLGEARQACVVLAILEGVLFFWLGWQTFLIWLGVFIYTLVMFKEFFMGVWLRPKMELYALLHTLVAAGIGLLVTSMLAPMSFWNYPTELLWFIFAANWGVFNTFEFARKTFAPSEEQEPVDSYSKRLKPLGASLLCLINIVLAVSGGLALLNPSQWILFASVLVGVPLAVMILYVCVPLTAPLYRGVMQGFIIGFYWMVLACLNQ